MPVPTLTTDQRREAYDRSLRLRRERAELKRLIPLHPAQAGPATAAAWHRYAIADAMQWDCAQGMKVYDLVTALPGIGRAKAVKLFTAAGISTTRTVAQLGPRQRERLLALL